MSAQHEAWVNLMTYVEVLRGEIKVIDDSLKQAISALNQTLSDQGVKLLDHLGAFESFQKWVNRSLGTLSQDNLVLRERVQDLESFEQQALLIWDLIRLVAVLMLIHTAFSRLLK